MKVHTIYGETGEYSEVFRWPVISFLDKREAKEYIKKAQLKANAFERECNGQYYPIPKKFKKYDSKMRMSSIGTFYLSETTEIKDF